MVMRSKVELIVARNQFLDAMLNNFITRGSGAGLKDQVGIIEYSSARCWRQLSRSALRPATVGSVTGTGDCTQLALLLAQPTSLAPRTAYANLAGIGIAGDGRKPSRVGRRFGGDIDIRKGESVMLIIVSQTIGAKMAPILRSDFAIFSRFRPSALFTTF